MFRRAITRRTRIDSAKKSVCSQAQAVLEADTRLPAEDFPGRGHVRERVPDVTRAGRGLAAFDLLAEEPSDRLEQVVDAVGGSGRDVEDAAVRALGLGGAEVGVDDVGDVREVAGLAAVAEDRDRLAAGDRGDEGR